MTRTTRIRRSLVRNLLQAIPTMFVIVTIGFLLMQLAPGDVADFLAAEAGAATEEGLAAIRRAWGLDLPVIEQLMAYYYNLAHFSLGVSPRFGVPVSDLILSRLPSTLLLMGTSILFAIIIGLVVGTTMALRQGQAVDRVLSLLSLIFYSIPNFWIALMLIVFFAVTLGWLPSGGGKTIGMPLSGWELILDRLYYLTLPALALSLNYLAIYARLTRAAVIEASTQDHVRTATAKGLPRRKVVRRHILRNALIPITTLAGTHVAGMLGGTVIIETVFSWPGMGRLAYEAVLAREYTVLLGILLMSSLLVIVVNMAVDLVHALLDPRLEVR